MTQKFDIDALIYEFRKLQLPEWQTDKYQDLRIPYEQGDWIGLEKALDIRLCYLKEVRPPFQPRKQLAVQLEIARTNAHEDMQVEGLSKSEISRMATTLKKTITTAKPNASERGIRRIRSLEDELKRLEFEKTTLVKDNEELLLENDRLECDLQIAKKVISNAKKQNSEAWKTIRSLEDELKRLAFEKTTLVKDNEELLQELDESNRKSYRLETLLKDSNDKIRRLEQENDDLVTRLRHYASARLTQDNPDVADLSDLNRPTKLAEKFLELYDNEWTDGFEMLTETYNLDEKDSAKKLLDTLYAAYKFCLEVANKQDVLLKMPLIWPGADSTDPTKDIPYVLVPVQLRNICDLRRQTCEISLKYVQQNFMQYLQQSNTSTERMTDLSSYVNRCVELCWHMALHSPVLYIDMMAIVGDNFDKDKYRYFHTSGTKYRFIVWPALYLRENGPLLAKGIAEA